MDSLANLKLIELLNDLIYELDNDAPILKPKSKSGFLAEREFAQSTSVLYKSFFDSYCPFVIYELIGLVSDKEITLDAVNKWINEVREHNKKKSELFRPDKIFKSL